MSAICGIYCGAHPPSSTPSSFVVCRTYTELRSCSLQPPCVDCVCECAVGQSYSGLAGIMMLGRHVLYASFSACAS